MSPLRASDVKRCHGLPLACLSMDDRVLRELGDELMRLTRRRAQAYPGLAAGHLRVPAALAAHRGAATHAARARRRAAARPVDGDPAGERRDQPRPGGAVRRAGQRRAAAAAHRGRPDGVRPGRGRSAPRSTRPCSTSSAPRALRRWWPSCGSSTTGWTGHTPGCDRSRLLRSRLRPCAARRPRWPRRRTPPAAPSAKHHLNAHSVGNGMPPNALVELVSTVAITAAASVVPTERIRALTPTADAASVGGTASRIRVGIAAYPMPTPAEATRHATISSHGELIRKNADQVAAAEHGRADHERALGAEQHHQPGRDGREEQHHQAGRAPSRGRPRGSTGRGRSR